MRRDVVELHACIIDNNINRRRIVSMSDIERSNDFFFIQLFNQFAWSVLFIQMSHAIIESTRYDVCTSTWPYVHVMGYLHTTWQN